MAGRVRRYRWWLAGAAGTILTVCLLLVAEEQPEPSPGPPPTWMQEIRVGMTEKEVDALRGATGRPDSFYRPPRPEIYIVDRSGYAITVLFDDEWKVYATSEIKPPVRRHRVTWLQRLGLREGNPADGPTWLER